MIHPYNNKTQVLNTEGAKGYLLAATDNNDFVELHLAEKGLVPAHSLPIDVTFYVVSGRGVAIISGKQIRASKGDIIEVKKDLDRVWQNPYTEPLVLLVVKQK